jgi:hypothetical protein
LPDEGGRIDVHELPGGFSERFRQGALIHRGRCEL